MCGSKGTSTTSSTFTPPASVQANYDYLANQAKSVAATPFQQYQGEMVAGLTPTQEAGIQNVNASAGLAQPYYQAGTGYVQQGATPFGQQALNQYMSPYINDVVSQTMANLNETNAQQQQQLLGNAIQRGAFGGDRAGVAQAELARQQNLATGQTLANVLQGGYGQALGQFNADQARALQAGSSLGQLGAGAQGAALQGAQAQLSAGAQQQAVQQAQDVANQQQFQAAQAYPFQTTQYLGNLLLGIGGQSGGTALTAQPQGNIGTSLLGGLLTAGQMFRPFKDGGSVDDDNSMGGAVHEGLGRAAYALDGGVDYIPYAEQPSGGSTKPLSLADVMQVPTKVLKPVGGKANISQAPEPAKEGETMMDIAKQLANASPESKANLKANVAALRSNLGLGTVAPADVLPVTNYPDQYSMSGMMGRYASGGVVGRHGYANDGTVQSDPTADQQPAQGRTLAEAIAGHPLSEEANMGLLAAGLGMLSNKSPIFGIGVGEGATAGLGTYYNALANKRAYERQQRELELQEEQRQIERQRVGLEAAKNPYEIARLKAETAAQQAGLYEMRMVPGIGMVRVNKLTGTPELVPLPSNIQSSQPATQPTVPSAPKVSENPNVPSTEKKEPTTDTEQTAWKPVLSAPQNYLPQNQINMFDPEIAKTAREVAKPVLEQYQNASDMADQQIYRLTEMNSQAANLPDTGFLSPGAFADQRYSLAQNANAFVQSMGGKPIFDQNSLASAEQIQKDSFRLGADLARTMGREPGFIVQQSVQANPGINNTKLGWARITSGLEQAARYQQDKNTFLSDYYQRYGNINGAEDLFRKLNPPQKYVERAVLSTVDPQDVQALRNYVANNKDPSNAIKAIDSHYGQGVAKIILGQ